MADAHSNKILFTNDALSAFARNPPAKRIEISDALQPGLRALVLPKTGSVNFFYKASLPSGARPTKRLGEFTRSHAPGKTMIAAARSAVRQLKAKEQESDEAFEAFYNDEIRPDRRAAHAESARASSPGKTTDEVFALFMQLRIEPQRDSERSIEEVRSVWRNDFSPDIGSMNILDVKRTHLRDIIVRMTTSSAPRVLGVDPRTGRERVRTRPVPGRAEKAISIAKQFFGWAERTGYLTRADGVEQRSPADALDPVDLKAGTKKAIRALTAEEITLFWHGLEHRSEREGKLKRGQNRRGHGIDRMTILAARFFLLVPDRSGELYRAQRDEVEFKADGTAIWHVPPEHRKARPEQREEGMDVLDVFLPWLPAQLMREMIELGGKDEQRVCPLHRNAVATAMRRLFRAGAVVLPGCKRTGNARPTPHSLRHTFATRAPDLGVSAFDVDRCLDHVIGGVQGRYNCNEYFEARKAALIKWAEWVGKLCGVNVTPLASQQAA